jgi:hypothetical protein
VPQAGNPAQIVVVDVHAMLGEEVERDPMNVSRCYQLSATEGSTNCGVCGRGATRDCPF